MNVTGSAAYEEQQYLSPKLLAFILISTGISGIGAYFATRHSPEAGTGLVIILAAMMLLFLVFRSFKLTTAVDDAGVRINGMWFVDRRIAFSEIASAEKRVYRPLVEYGGWGYRIGPSGKAYNAHGNEGVQLVLRDGGRVLIGSQRAAELADVVAARLSK